MTTSPRAGHVESPGTDAPAQPAAAAHLAHDALLNALKQLMEPLASLAVARGVPYASVDELMKRCFVDAAKAAQPNADNPRLVSRISTATGLNRRDVTRLTQSEVGTAAPRASPATQVFTRWIADPSLRDKAGAPLPLPRQSQGSAASFEKLARTVTTDVHPRSLLDELCRLGLAHVVDDMVHLAEGRFVPRQDGERMLGFLGSNAGDHLRAAVANVLAEAPPHLEQAVFADELSPASIKEVSRLLRAQWQSMLTATVPELQRMIDSDRSQDRPGDQRVRVGMYMYSEPMAPPASPPSTPKAARAKPPRAPKKK